MSVRKTEVIIPGVDVRRSKTEPQMPEFPSSINRTWHLKSYIIGSGKKPLSKHNFSLCFYKEIISEAIYLSPASFLSLSLSVCETHTLQIIGDC